MDVVSWDGHNINDTTNYISFLHHQAYGLPPVKAVTASRLGRWPVISAVQRPERVIFLEIIIRNLASLAAKQVELQQWFDPEDETPKKLVVEDLGGGTGGGNDRYVYAICEELQAAPNDENNYTFVATLRVHGDVRWRESTATNLADWAVTASGQTTTATNNGKDVAYPIITIKPTAAKTGGYLYKRYCPVRWRVSAGVTRYPVDICDNAFDTATLVGAAKMQADGDDLRVFVNGVEVDRWLQDINTATTQVWVNLTFQPKQEADLLVAIADSGAITEIEVDDDISGFPSTGTLMIGSEAFVYTGKSDALMQFTGITRAAKGTSMAAHAVGDDVWWNQNEVWINYGNASAAAPATDDTFKPIFSLASTNTSWVYADFGAGGVGGSVRAGTWGTLTETNAVDFYTANRHTDADPWSEIGLYVSSVDSFKGNRWLMQNVCGITAANFTNGEKYMDVSQWNATIFSAVSYGNWVTEYSIPAPSAIDTWESWSRDETLATGSTIVGLYLKAWHVDTALEAADCTLTLDSNYTPVATIGAEQGNYTLDCQLVNSTTGDIIAIYFEMAVDATLQINTDLKTITYLADNSNQLQALTLVGGARKDWFPLAVGANTWQFNDTGTNAVTVDATWEERHYQ